MMPFLFLCVARDVLSVVVKNVPDDVRGPQIHCGFRCDTCEVFPIVGLRHTCYACGDYDLCDACLARGLHAEHAGSLVTVRGGLSVVQPATRCLLPVNVQTTTTA